MTISIRFDEGSTTLDDDAVEQVEAAVRAARDFIEETGRSLRITATGFGNGYVNLPGAGAPLTGRQWADTVTARLTRIRDKRAKVTGTRRANAVLDRLKASLADLVEEEWIEIASAVPGGRGPAATLTDRRRVELTFAVVSPVSSSPGGPPIERPGGHEPVSEPSIATSEDSPEHDVTDRGSTESEYSQNEETLGSLAAWLTALVHELETLTGSAADLGSPILDDALRQNPLLRALRRRALALAGQVDTARLAVDEARAALAGMDEAGAERLTTMRELAERLRGESDSLQSMLDEHERILQLQDIVVELRRSLSDTVASGRARRRLGREVRRLEVEAAREFEDGPGDGAVLTPEERSALIRTRIEDAVVRHQVRLAVRVGRRAAALRTADALASARKPTPRQVARSLEGAIARRPELGTISPVIDGGWAQRLAYFWLVHQRAQVDVALLGLDPASRRAKRVELRILYLALRERLSELLQAEAASDEIVEAELAELSDALLAAVRPIEAARWEWFRTGAQPWEVVPSEPTARYALPAYLRGSLGPELVQKVAPGLVRAFADEVVDLLPQWLRAHYADRVREQVTTEWLADNWGNIAGGALSFHVGPFRVTLWAQMGGGSQLGDEIHVRSKHTTALTAGSRAGRVHFFMSDGTLNMAWAMDAFGGKRIGALDLHGHDAFAGVATYGWADHYEKPQSGYGMRIDQTVKGSTYRAVPFGMSVQAFAKVEVVGLPGFSWSRDNTQAAPILSNGVELAVSREVLYPLNEAARAASRSVFPALRDGRWQIVSASRVARDEPVRLPRWSWVQAFNGARELAAAVATAVGAKPGSELERRVQEAITAETVIAAFPLARSKRGWEIVLGAPGDGPDSVTVWFEFTNPGLVLRGDSGSWADYAQTLVTYQDVVTAHADMIDIPPTLMFAALQLYHGKAIGDFDPGFQLLTYLMPWVWREAARVSSGLSGDANELSSVRLAGEPTALIAVKTRAVLEIGHGGGLRSAVDLPDDGTTLRVLDRDLPRWFGEELPPLLKKPVIETPEQPLMAPKALERWWPAWVWIAELGEGLENLYQPLVEQINERYPGALPYRVPGHARKWVTSPIAEANLRALKRALSAEQLATGLPRMRTTGVPVTLQWKQYAGLTRQVYVWLRARPVDEPHFQYRMPDGEQDFFTINTHDLTGASEQIWGSWWGAQFVFGLGALGRKALEAVEFRPILAARLAKTLGITSGHVLWSLFGAAIDDLAVFGQRVQIEASLSADPIPRDPTMDMPGAYPPDAEDEGVIPGRHVVDITEEPQDGHDHTVVTMEREDPNVQVTEDGRVIATDDITFTMPVQLTSKPVAGDDGRITWAPFYDMAGDRPVWTAGAGPEWPDQSVLLPYLGGLREEIEQAFAERFGVELPAWEQVRLADSIHLLTARIQDLQHPAAGDEGGWPIWAGKVGFRERDVLHRQWGEADASVRVRARVVRAESSTLADSFGDYNEYGSLDLHGLYEESGRGGQTGLRVRFPISLSEDTTATPQPQLLRRVEHNHGENSELSGSRSRMTLDVSTGTSFLVLGTAEIEFDVTLAVSGVAPDPSHDLTVGRDGWFVHSAEQADEIGLVPAHRKTGQARPANAPAENAGETAVQRWPGPRVKERDLHVPGWLLDGEHGIGNAGVKQPPRTREFAKKIYQKVKKAWGHHVAAELDKELIKALSSAGSVAVIDGGLTFDVPLADHFPMVRTGSLRVVLKGRLKDPGYQGISLDRFYSGFQVGADRTREKTKDRRVRWAADARAWIIHDLHPSRGGDPNSFWYNHTYSYATQNEQTRTESSSTESKVSHTGNDNTALSWYGVDFTADLELSQAPVLLFDIITLGLLHTSQSLRVEHAQNGKAVQLHLDPHLMTAEPPPVPRMTVLPSPAKLPKILDRRVSRTLSDAQRRELGATPARRLRSGTSAGDLRDGFQIPAEAFQDAQLIGLPGLDILQGLASDLMGAPGGESWSYAWGDIFRQLTSTITQTQLSGRSAELFGSGGFAFPIREPGRFGGYLGTLTLAVHTLEFTFETSTPEVMIRNLKNHASVARTSGGRSKVTFHSPWALMDIQMGGRPADGNNAAGPFLGVDYLGIDTTVMADRGAKTMSEHGPKTTGRNVTPVGVKPTYLLIWQAKYRDPWFIEYTPDVGDANGALLRVPTEKLDHWRDATWHQRDLDAVLPTTGPITGMIGDAVSRVLGTSSPVEAPPPPPARSAGQHTPGLIEGDYTVGYPRAYLERAQRYAAEVRPPILGTAPHRRRELTDDEQAAIDTAVNTLMEPHFRAALRHAGIVDRSMPPNGDCFFETVLTEDAPAVVRQRLRDVLAAEPTVAGIRQYMAAFLETDFALAALDPDAVPVVAHLFPNPPATEGDAEARARQARYVDDIRRMGSYNNAASDRVPEMFSLIFGIPIDLWQPRYRHQIGWSSDDPAVVPMPLIRQDAHYYFAGRVTPREPTLRDPAAPHGRVTTRRAESDPTAEAPVSGWREPSRPFSEAAPEPLSEVPPQRTHTAEATEDAEPRPQSAPSTAESDRARRFPIFMEAPQPSEGPAERLSVESSAPGESANSAGRPSASRGGGPASPLTNDETRRARVPSEDPPPYQPPSVPPPPYQAPSDVLPRPERSNSRLRDIVGSPKRSTSGRSLRIAEGRDWWDKKKFDRLQRTLRVDGDDLVEFSLKLDRIPDEIPALAKQWKLASSFVFWASSELGVTPESLAAIRRHMAKLNTHNFWTTSEKNSSFLAKGLREKYKKDADWVREYLVTEKVWPAHGEELLPGHLILIAHHAGIDIDINGNLHVLVRFLAHDHDEPIRTQNLSDFLRSTPQQIDNLAVEWRGYERQRARIIAELYLKHHLRNAQMNSREYAARGIPEDVIEKVIYALLSTTDFAVLLRDQHYVHTVEDGLRDHNIKNAAFHLAALSAKMWRTWPPRGVQRAAPIGLKEEYRRTAEPAGRPGASSGERAVSLVHPGTEVDDEAWPNRLTAMAKAKLGQYLSASSAGTGTSDSPRPQSRLDRERVEELWRSLDRERVEELYKNLSAGWPKLILNSSAPQIADRIAQTHLNKGELPLSQGGHEPESPGGLRDSAPRPLAEPIWHTSSRSSFTGDGDPVPPEEQFCVSAAVITWTGGLASDARR